MEVVEVQEAGPQENPLVVVAAEVHMEETEEVAMVVAVEVHMVAEVAEIEEVHLEATGQDGKTEVMIGQDGKTEVIGQNGKIEEVIVDHHQDDGKKEDHQSVVKDLEQHILPKGRITISQK